MILNHTSMSVCRNRWTVFLSCIFLSSVVTAQRIDLDLFGGFSNYQGDLQPKFFTLHKANPGAAIFIKYGITENLFVRAGFSVGSIAADDADNRKELQQRNLNFRSGLREFSAGLEYRFFSPEQHRFTPYVFISAGVFKYKPYTYYGGEKIFLQPLGTEGQGLPQKPGTELYSLTQFSIPYGLGVKYQINCNLNIGIEFRHTKAFSDYLDDVSSTYVDQAALLHVRGQTAVDVAWRGDEFNGAPYPASGSRRGNPEQGDWYYFTGITIGLRLKDCISGRFSLGGIFNRNSSANGSRIDCPKF
ncbi:MAG TPA: DUF6089 family protein [Phnomibacter sp.]|nr:DUF6089 family protein [Phnomibacter sp.]